ncbi:methyltransferase family protein [Branchiibius hedensis]|uniref:Methyltransferase domain-containing protein n=1 Tax=Branchiibius hedensis TaxID=672460 RepID=A0A2Y8ZU24_9MICO|nr:methyltransferase domain-containing protein [Branchiibius hedensis]PWJ26194.1 methyltransferase family protein [Branchiibius hedensis]SSA35006.1 Methyltransferase domain-containing protein [Branchiibius hedensis]
MDAELVARLATGEGWGLLQSLPPYDEHAAIALGSRLRADGFDPDLVAAALTQSRLRSRAVAKFGDAAQQMLFTADGVEQATRARIAALHASRFADAGVETVFDLGCGIGADAIALAEAGLQVHAVDADEATAAVAAVNLRPWQRVSVQQARAEDVVMPSGEAARGVGAWLDPARRTPGVTDAKGRTRRTFSLEELAPRWDFVLDVAHRLPAVGAKLSPSMPHGSVPNDAAAEWVSYRGEVLECAVWWGSLAPVKGRSAVVVLDEHAPERITEADAADATTETANLDQVHGFLYEADRAVIRAGLTGALINAVDGRELAPGLGYVVSAKQRFVPWAKRYAVREAIPFNVKALRARLRDEQIGNLTIKKKGVSLDADALRRQLRLSGSRSGTIAITRVSGVQAVLLLADE